MKDGELICKESKLSWKYEKLREIIKGLKSAVVAFSGGLDSTFLLKVAHELLGENLLAVTADSALFPRAELEETKLLASFIGARHVIIKTDELSNGKFRENPPQRCYFCKKELFTDLLEIAKKEGMDHVLYGETLEDSTDHRPGRKAAIELGIKSPLTEAGLFKNEIRELSKMLLLPTWNKPPFACLASRIPFNSPITYEKLLMIEGAENVLRRLGIKQFRVRHHEEIARIEVSQEDFRFFMQPEVAGFIARKLHRIGFTYVTIDLEGYRTGSLSSHLRD
jgi:uncharacterized protein